jgi:hypothetical protein
VRGRPLWNQPLPEAQVHVDGPVAKRGAQNHVPDLGWEGEEEGLGLPRGCPRLGVGWFE